MSLTAKKFLIAVLGAAFLVSLIFVQWMEVQRRRAENGEAEPVIHVPASSTRCVECHENETPGIVGQWRSSMHARKGVGCFECHEARQGDVDGWTHEGARIATIVTPLDCSRCHPDEAKQFWKSHHSRAGRILHSLDNRLAEVAEGNREPFDPHSPTPGRAGEFARVDGRASATVGCMQCHGSKIALAGKDGSRITLDELKPDADGHPTNAEAVANVLRDADGRPKILADTWPNTGIGRFNLDGSEGSCTACHSRHDFSPRRARQPENCGKCHLGPDHPQKEIYEESKHGIAYRDLRDRMNLDSETWILGEDYDAAPTCASCHMSGNKNNGGKITHDPGERISWTNRPPVSLAMDTIDGEAIKESDPAKRRELIAQAEKEGRFSSAMEKREAMKTACHVCHAKGFVDGFYQQYDGLVVLYNEKFGKPGLALMKSLWKEGILTKAQFDEPLEWTWFYLWHHEGRRARHGAAMMAPDYAHWHGMFEVADRFYNGFVPEIREACEAARARGQGEAADRVLAQLEAVLARPEHQWSDAERNQLRGGESFEHYK